MAFRRTMVRTCAAGALGLMGTLALASPAGAAKVPAVGSVTCSYGTTITFDPPLQPGIGTLVPRGTDELVTLAPASIGSCTGSVTAGSVPTSGTNPKPIVVKVKPSVIAKSTDYAGGCLFLTAFQLPIKHAVVDWTAATGLLKPSKVGLGISGFVTNLAGELGFSYGASTTGSFAGSSALNLFLDPASTTAIENCEANVPGTISSVTLDPAQSSISLG